MTHPIRTREPNLTYHTISRCIEKRLLLKSSTMKDLVIDVICQTQKKYDFNFIGYEIMDNHFHFVIQSVEGGADISRIMQYIKARVAERYNKAANRIGPFWNERFKDVIVEKQENPRQYFFWLLWYIAFNAVKAGKCRDPRDYRHSSINSYLTENHKSRVKITRHIYFQELGGTFKERVQKFLLYEEAYRKRIALVF